MYIYVGPQNSNSQVVLAMQKKCPHCQEGYTKKNGVYTPCKHCITPDRFYKTLEKAITSCTDPIKKKALRNIKSNLPDYPVMALLEAEFYGGLGQDFIKMLKEAFDIKPFMDVKYRDIN